MPRRAPDRRAAASRPAVLLTARSGRVRAARRLSRRRTREERRLFLAEGANTLLEALAVPGCVQEVFATRAATAAWPALVATATAAGLPWQECEDEAVHALSGTVTPPGLVAVCRFLDVDADSLLADPGEEDVLVACVDVRDPGNAGTLVRTADAVGARGVLLVGDSVDPYNPKTVRATVGSLFHVPVARGVRTATLLDRLRAGGYRVLAADGHGELDLFSASGEGLLSGPLCWVFGNEAHGLPAELAGRCDHRVAVPIRGGAESLNLPTAAAVCLYETLRARG